MTTEPTPFEVDEAGRLFHGTKADLQVGDLLVPGRNSNYAEGRTANHVYVTRTLDAATWGAELAAGDGPAPRSSTTDTLGPAAAVSAACRAAEGQE